MNLSPKALFCFLRTGSVKSNYETIYNRFHQGENGGNCLLNISTEFKAAVR